MQNNAQSQNLPQKIPMTAVVATLGCKANQYDSSAMEELLASGGISIVDYPGPADAYVINTCTVTGSTDSQSRLEIRKARRMNPDAVVIVTGCYAQVSPEAIKKIDGVDYILGNPEKGLVLECLKKGRRGRALSAVERREDGAPMTLRALTSGGRTRANLKIQDGCDRACSYCIIPKARGVSRSLPLEALEKEVGLLVQKNYKEIILTGIHLGAYGADLKQRSNLCEVIRMMGKKNIACRVRLSSLDPDEVTDELIELLAASKSVCNHLHLALQSGDDTVLKMMRRPYAAGLFVAKVLKLASAVKGISIGVDVIAGFPGEGDKEFENTFALLEAAPISYLHVFPFSERAGTVAANLPGKTADGVVKQRCLRLKSLDARKRLAFYRSFEGTDAEVLFETSVDAKTGLRKGKTANYIPVLAAAPPGAAKKILTVRLENASESAVTGSLKKPWTA